MRSCLFLAGIIVLGVSGFAQEGERNREFTVRGAISAGRPLIGDYIVELASTSGPKETAPISGDGSFEIHLAQSGPQHLRIVGPNGMVVHEEMVYVNGPHQMLDIRLAENIVPANSTRNTVTLQELQHRVPAQAKKAFDRGEQAVLQGKSQVAIEAFREAVSLDPEYADALNELGAAEAGAGDLAHAAEEFQKAIDVAPEHAMALPNLSIVLAKLGRFREAEQVARRALKVVPDSARIRYILAASIVMEHGDSDEALDNLERAAGEIPRAHLMAAEILIFRGKQQDAIVHLEEYLRTAPPDDKERPMAEARLNALRH